MNSDKNLNKGLDAFLNDEQKVQSVNKSDEVVIPAKTGLVERIEKKLITADGRELLREIYR